MRDDQHVSGLLTGEIIDAKRATGLMQEAPCELRNAEIRVISAYLTLDSLREPLADVSTTNRVRILARCKPIDLMCGAADLASFDLAHSRGWKHHTSQVLHAKAFVLGEKGIYIDSANLTRHGFSIGTGSGNIEILTRVLSDERNVEILRRMFDGAVQLDKDLVEQV